MKNTKLLIGLAVVGGLAYIYSKNKKSLSENPVSNSEKSLLETSFSVGNSTYYTKNGKYYIETQVQCFKAPCYPLTSEITKSEYDNAKLKLDKSKADSIIYGTKPNGEPFFKGYDPKNNYSLQDQKFMQEMQQKLSNGSNPFGGVPKDKMFAPTSKVITAENPESWGYKGIF